MPKGKYFPHHVGQTSEFIVERIVIHVNGYLSGKYWLYSPDALDASCRTGLRSTTASALSDYFSGLSFFMAQVEPDLRLSDARATSVGGVEVVGLM